MGTDPADIAKLEAERDALKAAKMSVDFALEEAEKEADAMRELAGELLRRLELEGGNDDLVARARALGIGGGS